MSSSNTHLVIDHTIGCNVNFPQNSHLHPNGLNYVLAAGANIIIGNLNDPHEQTSLNGHDDLITCVAISPDGRFIASGQRGKNADVIVWSFDNQAEIYRFSEHDHGINCLAFSHDGRYLATCGNADDQKMFIWDLGTGRIITWVTVNPNPTTAIIFAGFVKDVKFRDTNVYQMATVGPRGFTLWNVDVIAGQAIGQSMQQFSATLQSRQYESVAVSPDGRWAFAGSTTGDVISVSLKTRCLQGISRICSQGVKAILVAPDNRTLYVAGGDGSISEVRGVSFQSPDGNLQYDDHDFEDGMMMAQLAPSRSVTLDGPVTCLQPLASDWSILIASTQCGTVSCLRAADLANRVLRHTPNHGLTDVTFLKTPNHEYSNLFLTTDMGGYLSMWDLDTHGMRFKVKTTSSLVARPMCVSASEDFAVVGHDSGLIRAFDLSDGRDLWHLDCSEGGSVKSIELSKNQRFFISGHEKGVVKVWSTRQKECQHSLKQHTAEIHQVKMSEDNLTAFTVGKDRALYSWDLTEGRRATGHFVRTGAIHSVALTHDPNVVTTTCQTGQLNFWDLRAMRPVFEVDLMNGPGANPNVGINAATGAPVAPIDRFLTSTSHVSAGGSGNAGLIVVGCESQLRSFDMKKGTEVAHVKGVNSTGVIRKVSFAPDGRQVVSVGDDQTITVVNVFSE